MGRLKFFEVCFGWFGSLVVGIMVKWFLVDGFNFVYCCFYVLFELI